MRSVFPLMLNEKPKGSFHKPKPQVPGRLFAEARRRNVIVSGGLWGKHRRDADE